MDAIDTALLTAFNNLAPNIRGSRLETARRFARTKLGVLRRPLRDSCLVLRASDLRINEMAGDVEPDDGPENCLAHEFELRGEDIAFLNEPVFIGYPGIPQYEAAKLFGRTRDSMASWIEAGVFRSHTVNAHSLGVPGKPIHIVSTRGACHASNQKGAGPHPFFGSMWRYLHERIPRTFAQSFRREPIFRDYGEKDLFRGWKFICPGLLRSNPDYEPCGRSVGKLYSPTTFWNIYQALDFRMDLKLGDESIWSPGQEDALLHRRAFACHHCWKLQYTEHSRPLRVWNQLVTHITGGLLYGAEVPMPEGIDVSGRKQKYRRHVKTEMTEQEKVAAERRVAVRALLGDVGNHELTAREIGVRLGATVHCIRNDMRYFKKACGVGTREELMRLFVEERGEK